MKGAAKLTEICEPTVWTPTEQLRIFAKAFNTAKKIVYLNNVDKGWYDEPRSFAEGIALTHTELSEALEADRFGDPQSDKIPKFTGREEELADVLVRIMDEAQRHNLRVGEAFVAKVAYNATRPRKHGKSY